MFLILVFGNPGTVVARQKSPSETNLTYNYDTQGVRLEGVVIERKAYGPPGYGETPSKDAKTTILVLKLSRAINVEPAPDAKATETPDLDPAKNIHEVQLFVSRSKDPRTLIGRAVAVIGTLHESVTASQYTKVWVDVEKLTPQ